jgi:ADP-heptose:LPS heptosyltransferase
LTSKQFKKILIIRLSSLGDVLLATPLLNAIKREYGLCSIDFVVRNEYADAIRLNPNVEQVFLYSRDKEDITEIKKKIKSIG